MTNLVPSTSNRASRRPRGIAAVLGAVLAVGTGSVQVLRQDTFERESGGAPGDVFDDPPMPSCWTPKTRPASPRTTSS
jgi:hypothetical protein